MARARAPPVDAAASPHRPSSSSPRRRTPSVTTAAATLLLLTLLGLVLTTACAAAVTPTDATTAAADDAQEQQQANSSTDAFPPPNFFAPPSNLQARQNYTTLSKRTAVNSTHSIPFNLTNTVAVDRAVRVTNSTRVVLNPPPQVVARFNYSNNTQFRLNETDALDVADDEALDVMSNGAGKALAGELDGLGTVFPNGSVNSNHVTDRSDDATKTTTTTSKPSGLSAALVARAHFNVTSMLGTHVSVRGDTTVDDSSDVTVAGLRLDVAATGLGNTQFHSDDSDFADTADNGGTTVLSTGSGVALAGEVEEMPPPPVGGIVMPPGRSFGPRSGRNSSASRWRGGRSNMSVWFPSQDAAMGGGGSAGAASGEAATPEESAEVPEAEEVEEQQQEGAAGPPVAAPPPPQQRFPWRAWRARVAGR